MEFPDKGIFERTMAQLVKPRSVFFILTLIAIIVALQLYFLGVQHTGSDCGPDENYHIFQSSHFHLLGDHDLYSYHPQEHCNTYKYSPAFALLFGAMAYFPDWLGMVLWALLTPLVVFFALSSLGHLTDRQRAIFVLFLIMDYISCLKSAQTNLMVAGLLVLALDRLERRHYFLATLFIISTGFIKIFGFGAMLIFLFYPDKKRLALYSLFWIAFLLALPLLAVSPNDLLGIYRDWSLQISGDYEKYSGLSIYSFIQSTTGLEISKSLILATTLGITLVTVAQFKKWDQWWFRQLTLALLLVWFVPFNHKAESPSYCIAMVGIGMWFFSNARKWPDQALMWFAFFSIAFLYSDLTPRWIKNDYAFPYSVKAFPATLLWIRIVVEMWIRKDTDGPPLAEKCRRSVERAKTVSVVKSH